jgi:hypothetical protein
MITEWHDTSFHIFLLFAAMMMMEKYEKALQHFCSQKALFNFDVDLNKF